MSKNSMLIEILNDFEAALKEKPMHFKYKVLLDFVRKHRKFESKIFAHYVVHRMVSDNE